MEAMAPSFQYLFASLDVCTVLLCLTVFVIIVTWLIQSHFKGKNLPPGPTNCPFVGCIPELLLKKKPFHEVLNLLAQKYGPVCLLPIPFGKRAVVISGYEAVHEALNKVEFDWRPPFQTLDDDFGELMKGEGVVRASGEHWKEHRRFSSTALKRFGVGKRSFEDQIATESEILMKEMQSLRGSSFDPTYLFMNAVSNIICTVVMGKRFEYDDPEFKLMLYHVEDAGAHVGPLLLYLAVPFLRKIPFLPECGESSLVSIRQNLKDIVDQHRDSFDKENLRDFIDVYINHLQQVKKDKDVKTYMNDIELVAVVNDLFFAGTVTTSTTLRWALLYMMMYPDVQQRVHEEIDAAVGRNRLPKLSDKPNLPYTESVIHEIQRYGGIVVTTAGMRYTVDDTLFRGYTIPKDTYVLNNLRSVTRDPDVWEDPDVFMPERFLDDEGRVNNKRVKEAMVFSSGPRMCFGEQLARMELFVFFTHLMHRFSVKKSSDTDTLNIQPRSGTILGPFPFNIRAIERN